MPIGILIMNRARASLIYLEVFQLISNLFNYMPLLQLTASLEGFRRTPRGFWY